MKGHALVATATYVAAAAYCTWPLARFGAEYIFPRGSPDDILLVTWILAWDVHALGTDPAHLFGGNILHPAPHILAHSEHLLGALPAFAPALVLTADPVLALNVMMFASFVLGALFMHLLVWTWTESALAAYAAGLSFALAPWRINGLNWPHLLSTQYLPLVVLGLERTAVTRRPAAVLLLAVALSLQLLTSYYLAYMVAIVVVVFVLAHATAGDMLRSRAAWMALAAGVLPPALSLLLVSLPYLDADRAGVLHWARADDRLLEGLATFGRPGFVFQAFIGAGPTILALAALRAVLGPGTSVSMRTRAWALLLVLGCALAVSPGPRGPFGGAFSPYSWLEAVVPGFSLVRVPFRFGILASFAVAGLAGLGAWQIALALRGAPRAVRYVLVALTIGCAVQPGWRTRVATPVALPTRERLPAAHAWLAAHGDGGPLLELPMQERPAESGWMWGSAGARAMYFSTYHWLPLLNGYTGYMPPSAAAVEEIARGLPGADALHGLVACTGLRWILVHRLGPAEEAAWQNARGLRLAGAFPVGERVDRLYEVTATASTACDDARFSP